MRRNKRKWLARTLVRIALLRRQRTPYTPEWLAVPPMLRTGVTFTPEQRALFMAMVAA